MVKHEKYVPQCDQLVFMGIDQSLRHTGVTILRQEFGINHKEFVTDSFGISTSNDLSDERRIFNITNKISSTIDKYGVEVVIIEGLAYRMQSNNGRLLAGLFFSILTTILSKQNICHEVISPVTLKKFATNYGKSEKIDMLNALDVDVKRELSKHSHLKPESKKFEDIVDSYWLAKLGINKYKEAFALQ